MNNTHKFDHFVICDICSRKVRRSEVTRVTDKYNLNYGLVVCKDDIEKTNAQNYPDLPRKESVVDYKYVRPEQDPTYVLITTADEITNGDTVDFSGTTAGAPRSLTLQYKTSTSVSFNWFSPESIGNRRLIGWAVKRESPVGGGFSDLTTNTNSVDMSYIDTTVLSGVQYNYKIAAVTAAGTGTFSDTMAVTTL